MGPSVSIEQFIKDNSKKEWAVFVFWGNIFAAVAIIAVLAGND